jgi:hypothetical protein
MRRGASSVPGSRQPRVASPIAAGRTVGPASVDSGGVATVAIPAGPFQINLNLLSPQSFDSWDNLFLTSTDCSGTPPVHAPRDPEDSIVLNPIVDGLPGEEQLLYYPSGPGTPQFARSRKFHFGGPCGVATDANDFAPAAPPLTFTPPFHLETN